MVLRDHTKTVARKAPIVMNSAKIINERYENALYSYDIWDSKDGDILERIQKHDMFNIITRDVFVFKKDRFWLQDSEQIKI